MKNRFLVAVVAAGLSFSVAAVAQANEVKFGVVDIEKAIKQTAAGQKMTKELQAEFDKKKADLQKREGDLRKMIEDLEKKKNLLTEEARQKKGVELGQEQMKFQNDVRESEANIRKKERDLLEPIAKKMEETIDKMAKDGSYTAILDRRAVLWVGKSSDLTEQVVKEFDKAKK